MSHSPAAGRQITPIDRKKSAGHVELTPVHSSSGSQASPEPVRQTVPALPGACWQALFVPSDRKSTRLNSSHSQISYAGFSLQKKEYRVTSLAIGMPRIISLYTPGLQLTTFHNGTPYTMKPLTCGASLLITYILSSDTAPLLS